MADLVIVATTVAPVRVIEQFTGPAAEVILAGQYVRFNVTTGKVELGKGTTAAEARRGGIAIIGASVAGLKVTFVSEGIVNLGSALGALTYDDDVYLSDTDGTLADGPGTVGRRVGTVVPGWGNTTADKLLNVGPRAEFAAGEIGEASLTPASLTGTAVAVGAADNVVGAIPLIFRIDIAAGALAAKNVVTTHKIRVIDAWLVLRGAGVANTVLVVGNGATAITNAMVASGSDTDLVRAATIDDASHEIAAGGSLRVTTSVGATQPAATVYVEAIRVT